MTIAIQPASIAGLLFLDSSELPASEHVGETEGDALAVLGSEQPHCEQCNNPFERRQGSGGKAQRFCSKPCRAAWHAAQPKAPAIAPAAPVEWTAEKAEKLALTVAEAMSKGALKDDKPPAGDAFDWRDKDDVVIETQRATAIYWNPAGQVVIRQEAGWSDDDDPYLFFEPANLPRVIERLQTELDSWKRDHTRGRT
jgi:hypothetical protein